MSKNQTGEYTFVYEWFTENDGVWMTAREVAEEFHLTIIQARNALNWGVRTNRLAKEQFEREGELEKGQTKFGMRYRFRKDREKREEFKVAEKAIVAPIRTPKPEPAPILVEFDRNRLANPIKGFLTGIPDDRVQALDANTVIIWNSDAQHRNMRQMQLTR